MLDCGPMRVKKRALCVREVPDAKARVCRPQYPFAAPPSGISSARKVCVEWCLVQLQVASVTPTELAGGQSFARFQP